MRMVCPIAREIDVYIGMSRAREIAQRLGFDQINRTRIEIAVLELARNILVHANSGTLTFEQVEVDGQRGLAIEAHDDGPGIPDIELALRDGYSTAQTLGAGLPGVRRLMDTFEIESTVGVGTTVRAVKLLHRTIERRGGGR
jgi:serine/threonine-protein kinase RsbT